MSRAVEQWTGWKAEEAYRKKAQVIARSLGVFCAARYLELRHIPLEKAREWLLGVGEKPRTVEEYGRSVRVPYAEIWPEAGQGTNVAGKGNGPCNS